jgi:hypothetical protein
MVRAFVEREPREEAERLALSEALPAESAKGRRGMASVAPNAGSGREVVFEAGRQRNCCAAMPERCGGPTGLSTPIPPDLWTSPAREEGFKTVPPGCWSISGYDGTEDGYLSILHAPTVTPLTVMPRLDLGISQRHFRRGAHSSPGLRSRNGGFTPGDAKIKSWHDDCEHDGMGKLGISWRRFPIPSCPDLALDWGHDDRCQFPHRSG